MTDSIDKKIVKPTRHRYFNMIIRLSSIVAKTKLHSMPSASLLDLLRSSHFVEQKVLEIILYKLKIIDRRRKIALKDFDGQLELDSGGVPYWNVYFQTTALITPRRLTKAISQELAERLIDPTIYISPSSNFQQCDREKLFTIPESDFYPGHFNRVIRVFEELLRNELIKEAIEERPEKYCLYLKAKAEIETQSEIKNTELKNVFLSS